MKENNGAANRRKLRKRLYMAIGSFTVLALILNLFGGRSSLLNGGTAAALQGRSGNQKPREGSRSIDATTPLSDGRWQAIFLGQVHLVDLEVRTSGSVKSIAGKYQGLTAVFCRIEWGIYKTNTSLVAMNRMLVDRSPDCSKNRIRVDLQLALDRIREFDQQNPDAVHVLPFSGAIFHESRCGSTLSSNIVMAMNPAEHRIYVESKPPINALVSCGMEYGRCSREVVAQTFRDVVFLMQRSNDPAEKRFFIKFQSMSTFHIQTVQLAFPQVPWIFVYRDPVQVMMSYIKDGGGGRKKSMLRAPTNYKCNYMQRSPPKVTRGIVQQSFNRPAEQVTSVEYCAAHLASLSSSAVTAMQEHDNARMGTPINYQSLPDVLWEEVLPHKWNLPVDQASIDRMRAMSQDYSKGGAAGQRRKEQRQHLQSGTGAKDDSEEKEKAATPEVRQAVELALQPTFQALQALAKERGSGT